MTRYLAWSMNFSRLIFVAFSNNLSLLNRGSFSSGGLQTDPGFDSCDGTSAVASLLWFSPESLTHMLPTVSFCVAASLCYIFTAPSVYVLHYPPNLRRVVAPRTHEKRLMWRMRSSKTRPGRVTSAVSPPQTPCRRLSCAPPWVWSLDYVLSCSTYLRFTNGFWDLTISRRSSWPSPSW